MFAQIVDWDNVWCACKVLVRTLYRGGIRMITVRKKVDHIRRGASPDAAKITIVVPDLVLVPILILGKNSRDAFNSNFLNPGFRVLPCHLIIMVQVTNNNRAEYGGISLYTNSNHRPPHRVSRGQRNHDQAGGES
jgi:hypothetical protein